MPTITARLDDWLRDEIVSFGKAHGEGPSSAMRHVAQEWWAMQEFPGVFFRDGVSGRRAVLHAGPDVWEVIMVARDYGSNREGLYEHFGYYPPEAIDEALRYYEAFPEEIDARIAENERVGQLIARSLGY